MKILLPCHLFGPSQAGISTYVRELVKGLASLDTKNSYEVFLTRGSFEGLPFPSGNFRFVFDSSLYRSPLFDIAWHHLALPFKKCDLIHVPTIRRIPYLKRSLLVATIHDMAPFVLEGKYGYLRQLYHTKILSKLIFRLDRIIAVSNHTKQDIVRYTGFPEERISAIYPGIDAELFRPLQKKREGAPFFVYVSRLEHPGKNHLRLIEAFEMFRKRRGGFHRLILAGPEARGSGLIRKRAAESPFSASISVTGYLPVEKLVELYNACELMIYPSLYEGFGFPILEAMACGAKVACSQSSSLSELAAGYAHLFNPLDAASICRALEEAPKKSVQGAAAYARSFSWRRHTEEVLKLYRSL